MLPPSSLHLLDLSALRRRLERFATATGFSTALLSYPTGAVLLEVGRPSLCITFGGGSWSDLIPAADADDGLQEGYQVRRCHRGLLHAHAGVVVGGVRVATLVMGEGLTEPLDLEQFEKNNEVPDFDRDAYVDALSRLPVTSEDKLVAGLLFVVEVVSDLAEKGLESQLARQEAKEMERALEELRQAQESLSKSQGQLRTLVNAIPDLVWLKDLDGVYLACNSRFESFFGATEQEIVGKSDYDFVDRELADFFRENDRAAMRAGGPRTNEEEIAFASDGHIELLETIKTPMQDAEGQVIGVLGIGRDITERRQSEQEREALRAALSDARRMESVGRLAGGVAHDFNNLLSPILAYSQMLSEDLGHDEEVVGDLQQIYFAADRCRGLVQQLLAFGRKQPLSVDNADINRVIESFTTLIRGSVQESIEIVHEMGDSLPNVRLDPPRVEQVLMNLVLNGASAMPGGGVLTLRTQMLTVADGAIWDVEAGDYVQLSVSDTGSGIAPSDLERIFEPFFTTKGPKGHGLGLATVYGIAKQHGGDVAVQSEEGEGSTFHILFPAVQEPDLPRESPVAQPDGLFDGRERVLLVEDEQQVRKLAERILTRRGYSVVSASDGLEALKLLERSDEAFDLVVSDVVMPNLDGAQLARQISERWPGLKVMFMTGYSNDLLTKHELVSAKVKVVQKPFTTSELLSAVREVLDEARGA